ERIRLVVAHVADGRVPVERPPPAERELALEIVGPAERPVPAGFPDLRPAVREPERGIAIAAGLDELAELAVRDEAARERVRPEQHLVARRLVVEAEIPAVAADLE